RRSAHRRRARRRASRRGPGTPESRPADKAGSPRKRRSHAAAAKHRRRSLRERRTPANEHCGPWVTFTAKGTAEPSRLRRPSSPDVLALTKKKRGGRDGPPRRPKCPKA